MPHFESTAATDLDSERQISSLSRAARAVETDPAFATVRLDMALWEAATGGDGLAELSHVRPISMNRV